MAEVHATAIVDPAAELAASVRIGPWTSVGPHVRIGEGTTIGSHCVLDGHTTIGRDNRIFQACSLGAAPQDKKYAGEPTELRIGDRNTIREYCSINLGTVQDKGRTVVGDDNWIMAYVHIAHDCIVGNQTIIASFAGLAGHVELGDWAIVGGQSGLHQFVKFGPHAMCAFASHVSKDVPPYMMVDGNPWPCAASTPKGCDGAATRPSASRSSSRCIGCSTATTSRSMTPVRRSRHWRRASRRPPATSP